MADSLYILIVPEDEEVYTYEYNNLSHADNHFDFEESCIMFEYNNGEYHFVKAK